ncbi:MAG: hypothetical protein U0O22_08515 [Acutalibacteraceae bacterium]
MKFKLSWIPFIPVAILSVIVRVYQKLFIDSGVDSGFLSSDNMWLVYTGLIAFLFLVQIILCCADRKTSPYYEIKGNFLGGLFGVLTAGVIIFSAGINVGNLNSGDNQFILTALEIAFGVLGGIAILIMGISSFSGKNLAKKMGLFSIVAPIWCCVELVTTFVLYRKDSVHAYDMTNLFSIAFLTLAVFNLSMVYQGIKGRNPVKSVVLYGMPGFIVTVVYAVANAIDQIHTTGTYNIIGSLDIITFVLLSMYILFMMVELTTNSVEKTVVKNVIKGNDNIEQDTKKDEIKENESAESNKKVEISDVEKSVNDELDEVDNVIDNLEKADKDPEKMNPLSDEYFNSQASMSSDDDDYSKNLEDIDRLIDELNSSK